MIVSVRGDAWACFGDEWPASAEEGFEGVDGWVRLGEIPNDETAFWKACALQLNGGARSAWKRTVDFYVHVYADSPALPRLEERESAEPFWLGLHPFVALDRLYVSSAKVARGPHLRHPPERHPGLSRVEHKHKTLGFRLRLAADGTYFAVAR